MFIHLIHMNEGDLSSCTKYAITTHLSFLSELTSRVPLGGYGESIYGVSPLWQQKGVC